MTSEITKDSKHTDMFPTIDKVFENAFTQDEKDRIALLVRLEILEIEKLRSKHEWIITTNKARPKLEDEQKQRDRDLILDQHVKVVKMFTKDLDNLETILKKLESD